MTIYIYFYSNSGTEFFRNLRWMPSGPSDLLTFNFLSSSFYKHTHTHKNTYIERFFFSWNICQRDGTFTLWNSPTPSLFIILSGKDLGKEIVESICNILIFSDYSLISWGTCWFLWLTDPDTLQHELVISLWLYRPSLFSSFPFNTYLPMHFILCHKHANRT